MAAAVLLTSGASWWWLAGRSRRAVATALEVDRLRVASALPDAAALVRELAAFRVRFSGRGHASFAGAGEHDDLVVAVALVVWWRAWPSMHRPNSAAYQF